MKVFARLRQPSVIRVGVGDQTIDVLIRLERGRPTVLVDATQAATIRLLAGGDLATTRFYACQPPLPDPDEGPPNPAHAPCDCADDKIPF